MKIRFLLVATILACSVCNAQDVVLPVVTLENVDSYRSKAFVTAEEFCFALSALVEKGVSKECHDLVLRTKALDAFSYLMKKNWKIITFYNKEGSPEEQAECREQAQKNRELSKSISKDLQGCLAVEEDKCFRRAVIQAIFAIDNLFEGCVTPEVKREYLLEAVTLAIWQPKEEESRRFFKVLCESIQISTLRYDAANDLLEVIFNKAIPEVLELLWEDDSRRKESSRWMFVIAGLLKTAHYALVFPARHELAQKWVPIIFEWRNNERLVSAGRMEEKLIDLLVGILRDKYKGRDEYPNISLLNSSIYDYITKSRYLSSSAREKIEDVANRYGKDKLAAERAAWQRRRLVTRVGLAAADALRERDRQAGKRWMYD